MLTLSQENQLMQAIGRFVAPDSQQDTRLQAAYDRMPGFYLA